MGKFSKIFHHIESKDLRNKHEQKKVAKIQEEKKKKEFKQYLVSTMETKKYSWREGMTTSDVTVSKEVDAAPGDGEVSSTDPTNAASYTATDGVLAPGDDLGANVGTQIRASGTGEGHGGFNVSGNYLAFQGAGMDDAANSRFAVLSPVDSTDVDTIQIKAIVGNDSNGGEDPDASGEELYVMYKTPAMDQAMFLIQKPDGSLAPGITGTEDQIIPLGAAPNAGLNDYSLSIPDYARAAGTQFILIQPFNSGVGFDHYGVTEIKFQRKAPITVFVPLDNPEASSFIRSAPPASTPKKRKKAVDDKLEASDKYTGATFGNDFPGREVRVGGDDPFRSAKIGDDVEPSPQSKADVKKAFGAAQLKTALGQSDVQKADPQAKVTNIVKSGEVKSQPAQPQSSLGDFQTARKEQQITTQVKQNVNQVIKDSPEVNNLVSKITDELKSGKVIGALKDTLDPVSKIPGVSQIKSKIADVVIDAVADVTRPILDAKSAANTLNSYDDFLGKVKKNPNTPGATFDNPYDLRQDITDKDLAILQKATTSSEFKSVVADLQNKLGKPNRDLSNDKTIANLGGATDTHGIAKKSAQDQLNRMISKAIQSSFALDNTLHNNVQVDLDHLLNTGKVKLTKEYTFKPGGSVAEAEDTWYGKAVENVLGIPLDTMSTGPTAFVGAIAAKVGLGNTKQHGGVYESPGMHTSLEIPTEKVKTPFIDVPSSLLPSPVQAASVGLQLGKKVIDGLSNLLGFGGEDDTILAPSDPSDPRLPTNQAPPSGEGKRNSAYYREQPDKVLPGGIVLKWIPGAVTYKEGNPSLGIADPKDWIPGSWTDVTEYIPFTSIPVSQAKKAGMDVSATTAPGDRNGAQSDGTTTAPGDRKGAQSDGTFDDDGNYIPPGFENAIGTDEIGSVNTNQPELGYEPTNNLNIKANDIIGKSMGDIKNVSEADLDFLIQNGYPVDDIFFGGQTQSPVGDLIALGLSAAAIKLALPLLLKAGGSLVSLVKKEWGMRALTDAAFKTFEKTGVMPPWYHWAAHKLLPQPVLNTYAKLMGLKSIPQSILSTGGTKAGNVGLLGLGAAAVAKITELMLQGRNKEADKLVVTEMTKITNKNIDNMSDDEIYKVLGDLDSKKFDDYDKFIESSKVPSSFRSNLKTLEELGTEYQTLSDEMNSLEENPASFEAYAKNRTEISNEMFKFFSGGKDGYRNNPDLDPRVLIPDPKGLERTDYTTFRDSYKPFIKLDKEQQKAYENSQNHYKNKLEPAFDKAEAYAKANLTYDASSKMYQGTDEQILVYSRLANKAMKLSAEYDKLSDKFYSYIDKQMAMQSEISKIVDQKNAEYDKAMKEVDAKRKKLEDEYQKKYDYYRKIYDERFSYKTTQTFQDKLLKAGEDYTPAPLYGQRSGQTVKGFKSLGLKTKEEYEKELEELMNKSNNLADRMDWGGVDKLFLKELSMKAMNDTVKAGGSESFKGDDYNPTKPKPSNRRAEAAKKRREELLKAKAKSQLGSAGEIGGVDATAAATAAASKKDDEDTLIAGNYPSSFEQQILRNQLNAIQKSQGNAAAKKEQDRLMKMYKIHFPLASGGGGNTQLAHFKPRGKNLFERVSKLKKPNQFFNQDDIKPEFPENPPPKLDPKTGKHPEYGKKASRYKKLDPISANSMPPTGDPEIDAVVNKQKTINKIKRMAKNKY